MTAHAPRGARRPATAGSAFDWAVAGLGSLTLFGLHPGAWAHHRDVLDTFFTPWHGLLYSAYALLTLLLGWRAVRGGGLRPAARPAGYGHSLVGAALFAAGGLGDGVWHTLLGIEVGHEVGSRRCSGHRTWCWRSGRG